MQTKLPTRQLGTTDMNITRVGFGAWAAGGGGWAYGWGPQDDDASMEAIRRCVELGVNWIDTAPIYGIGHSEEVVGRALKKMPPSQRPLVFTKCGLVADPKEPFKEAARILSPESIRRECEASLRRLGVERIDLYQFHRPDPEVPYAESIGAFKELQDEGKVRWVGISNASVAQLEEALGIVDVVAVQNQLSLSYTSPIAKGEVQACTERGIAFLAWSPLGGIKEAADSASGVDPVRAIADAHGVSPQQVALAWLLSLGPTVIPIPGASRPETITDSLQAARLELSDDELRSISAAVDVA
jgi:aryl-alcohol dehydrogenase-like predicted oxidoreductase